MQIFQENRERWWILSDVTRITFLEYLEKEIGVRTVELKAESHEQSFVRYQWRDPSPLEIASSLRATAYLSHLSAVFLHGLSDLMPKVLYVNYEQSAKPRPSGTLTQEGIDRAFRGKQRESTFAFAYNDYRCILLSGKNTRQLAVQTRQLPDGGTVRVTSLERTLIDVAVRPTYAGGVYQVLEAYRTATPELSLDKLVATLEQLDYLYPYHQAIGFYLERAGVPEKQTERLMKFGTELKFYLAHGMQQTAFDERWQLFHPKGI